MHIRIIYRWCREKLQNYNVFVREENDYDDNDDEVDTQDPFVILKRQKFAFPRQAIYFYISDSFGILIFMKLINPQPRTIVVPSINPLRFDELYQKYNGTLSCPCSTSSILYKDFVSTRVTYHSVCDSIFVSSEWIKALYFENASQYGMLDFRTTASSQFRLLADLCSLSKSIVNQNLINFHNHTLVSIDLLSKIKVEGHINESIGFYNTSGSIRISSFLNYLRTITLTNYLISALNTNLVISFEKDKFSETSFFLNPTRYLPDDTMEYIHCGTQNPIGKAWFYYVHDEPSKLHHIYWQEAPKLPSVNGFYGSCTPIEALLSSTLDCLFDIDCLELFSDYFPAIDEMNLNRSEIVLDFTESNHNVNSYLLDLFIDKWTTEMNYSQYFHLCSPLFCTYITKDQIDIMNAVTLFISIYGGFTIVLRLIASFLIDVSWKIRNHFSNTSNAMRQIIQLRKFVHWLKQLNLFKQLHQRTEKDVKRQKITTRVYLILLCSLFIMIFSFNQLRTYSITIHITNPTLDKFIELEKIYPSILRCPCKNTIASYRNFISISPTLHQVCKSSFVDDHWISLISVLNPSIEFDWRFKAHAQFKLLSDLCRLANKTIDDAVNRFLAQSLIVSNVIADHDFNRQMNISLEQFFQSTTTYFRTLVDTVRLMMQVDQMYMETPEKIESNIQQAKLIAHRMENGTFQVKFIFSGTHDIYSAQINCICAKNPSCKSPGTIYKHSIYSIGLVKPELIQIMSETITGCTITDSLLFSTLKCFYSNDDCFLTTLNLLRPVSNTVLDIDSIKPSPGIYPMIYHSNSTHFHQNATVQDILKEIMIEQWNSYYFYDRFYQSCAPSHCIYSKTGEKKGTGEVILLMISLIGAMNTRKLVRKQKQQQGENQRLKLFDRLRILIRKLLALFNTDHSTAKRFGQWATRLYFVIFITTLVVLTIYTIVQPQTITKTFDKPSFILYNRLYQTYKNKLECSCSIISTQYRDFVTIQSEFHQICTSPLSSDQWRINITSGLVFDLYSYDLRDYRRFLSAHLQFLQGLCQLSNQSVNSSINQFHTSLFVTAQLLSKQNFDDRINILVEENKISVHIELVRLLDLIRSINHGNAIISTYGSNYEYIYIPDGYAGPESYLPTKPMIYDDGCSCGLHANCTSQAYFIESKSRNRSQVKGLKIGCTPSESFFLSTLEYLLHTITVILGLQGGLAIVLKWICPKLIVIAMKLYEYRKKRRIIVEPEHCVEVKSVESDKKESIETIPEVQTSSMSRFLILLLIWNYDNKKGIGEDVCAFP
ncbi:hypothetical protein I4U23_004265 [Adineta vaga]|nr:hypothetical protein I4U23_004265 [Adineta vaga]